MSERRFFSRELIEMAVKDWMPEGCIAVTAVPVDSLAELIRAMDDGRAQLIRVDEPNANVDT